LTVAKVLRFVKNKVLDDRNIQHHYVRDEVKSGEISPEYLDGTLVDTQKVPLENSSSLFSL